MPKAYWPASPAASHIARPGDNMGARLISERTGAAESAVLVTVPA